MIYFIFFTFFKLSKYQKFITIVKLPQKLSEWQKLSNYPKIVRKKLSWPDLPCPALCQNCQINPKIAKYTKIVKLTQIWINWQITPQLLNYHKIVKNLNWRWITAKKLNWPHLDHGGIKSLCCHKQWWAIWILVQLQWQCKF